MDVMTYHRASNGEGSVSNRGRIQRLPLRPKAAMEEDTEVLLLVVMDVHGRVVVNDREGDTKEGD